MKTKTNRGPYRTKKRIAEERRRKDKILWTKFLFWLVVSVAITIIAVANHYIQENKNESSRIIEELRHPVRIEKAEAANPYNFRNIKLVTTTVSFGETKQIQSSYSLSKAQREQEARIAEVAKVACDRYGFEDYCIRDLLGMAHKETSFICSQVGDGGKSHGCFQIFRSVHKHITEAQANDLEFATNWTLDRMVHYGYPKYRSNAIMRHNGTPGIPATIAYLSSVNRYVESTK